MTSRGVLMQRRQISSDMKYYFNGGIWLLRFEP